jgi:hypothetical protein
MEGMGRYRILTKNGIDSFIMLKPRKEDLL